LLSIIIASKTKQKWIIIYFIENEKEKSIKRRNKKAEEKEEEEEKISSLFQLWLLYYLVVTLIYLAHIIIPHLAIIQKYKNTKIVIIAISKLLNRNKTQQLTLSILTK
jgi:hypothetical protein